MVIPDALSRSDDRKPVRQTILGATNNKAMSVFSGFDNVPKNRVVRCRVPWNAFLVERRKQLTKAIGPSRIRVDDISTYKLWWRISEADGVCSNRNHELRIIKSDRYDSADRQFLLHTRLACVLCENNDLLDSFVPKHSVDLAPEVVTSSETLLVHPNSIARDRKFR